MIPGIDDIIKMLLNNECSHTQALTWINGNIDMAVGDANLKDLRDMFAAKAMQGMMADIESHIIYGNSRTAEQDVALSSYKMADEMLAARETKEAK
jgi:hypothetical protein